MGYMKPIEAQTIPAFEEFRCELMTRVVPWVTSRTYIAGHHCL